MAHGTQGIVVNAQCPMPLRVLFENPLRVYAVAHGGNPQDRAVSPIPNPQ
ncbi:MAG: hypothetical protein KME32_15875 [Mojavia pulchra JT2-VF2]|jgi:hypothetical protein|uniref:Uncharacterized protein n=1 Tax=Mojavia pulchra JT2-VF2 TaxID=287848 RepID=A0A951UHW9_9NOST|nr:hypothetical protein [Mojavia pulchra JT2-VF2]